MKERVCANCYSIAKPNVRKKGSAGFCIFLWICFIAGGIVGLLLAIFAFPIYCILGFIMFCICASNTHKFINGENIYSCPSCGAENPLPPKSEKGMEILNKLKKKGNEEAIKVIGFIQEEEKNKG